MINTMAQPWIRNIELIIGPVIGEINDVNSPPDFSKGLRVFTDGSQNGLRVRFQIHKHIQSTSRPSSIEVFNLSEASRQAIRVGMTQITLNVGYENFEMQTLFTGSLLTSNSHREGSDIVTVLQALPGYGGMSKVVKGEAVSDSFGAPVEYALTSYGVNYKTGKPMSVEFKIAEPRRLKSLLRAMGAAFLGVDDISEDTIDVPDDLELPKSGFAFAGLLGDALDKLARTYGFSWGVNNGIFRVYSDKEDQPAGNPIVISGDNGYLIRAEPVLYGPFQGQIGVSITSVLNPAVHAQPGQRVQLISRINPSLNIAESNPDKYKTQGYRVTSLTHSGDSHSSQWQTHMECLYMGNQS